MITHEEARESYKRLFESYLDGDWAPFPTRSDLDTYRNYITQQEKVSKLLELYRDYFYALPDEKKLLEEDIYALEEELK